MWHGCGLPNDESKDIEIGSEIKRRKMCFFVVFYFFEGDNPIKLNKSLDKFSFVP